MTTTLGTPDAPAPVGARAIGLLQNDPMRGAVALSLLAPVLGVPVDVDAVGTATIVDGSALVAKRKLSPTSTASLAALVGAPQGRASVVQLGTRAELRPTVGEPTLQLGPFRARQFAAAVVGGPPTPDAAALLREAHVATLPDFLRRCLAGQSEAEAYFLAVLAVLHERGQLAAAETAVDAGPLLAEAIRAVDARAPHAGPRHVTLTNGVDVVHVASGFAGAVVDVAGLAEDVAAAASPAFVDSSTARERNRRYRGVFVLGALDVPLKANAAMPPGATLQVLPAHSVVVVGRDQKVRLLG